MAKVSCTAVSVYLDLDMSRPGITEGPLIQATRLFLKIPELRRSLLRPLLA